MLRTAIFVVVAFCSVAASAAEPRPRHSAEFYATIQNSSRKANECLIFSGLGQKVNPERFLWGENPDLVACGWPSEEAMRKNKQAVFHFVSVGDNGEYIILNASKNGTEECLIFGGNGHNKNLERYLWEPNKSQYCGFKTKRELVDNQQAIFRLVRLAAGQYLLRNSSSGRDECLIISGNGTDESPSRYLWAEGPAEVCGWPSKADLMANKQAVWTITVLP